MSMPRNLLLVRHGQSEANVLQGYEKRGETHNLPEALRTRPDWEHRLSEEGVQQAEIAGKWIADNVGVVEEWFDVRYVSSFIRARETAAYLGGAAAVWTIHPMLHERDWGEFGETPRSIQQEVFPRTARMREIAPLFARLDGGEAIADNVAMRIRSFRDTLMRKPDENVLVVAHGDILSTARYILEEMLPEQWQAIEDDPSQRIANCSVLWYSRVNPNDVNDVRSYLNWRRMVEPNNLSRSPFEGQWIEIPRTNVLNGRELLESAKAVEKLID